MTKNTLMIAAMLLVLVGCKGEGSDSETLAASSKSGPDALTQSTDGIHFHNKKFGLSIKKPESWYSQSVEETMRMAAMGGDALSGGDTNMKAALDASLKSTLTLFSFFEFPPGTPGKTNPSIISMAENVMAYPGVTNGCSYLANMKNIIKRSQMKMTFSECHQDTISASTFGYVDAETQIGNAIVNQRYWACKKGGHAIAIIQTFYDEKQKSETTDLVKTIEVQCDSV